MTKRLLSLADAETFRIFFVVLIGLAHQVVRIYSDTRSSDEESFTPSERALIERINTRRRLPSTMSAKAKQSAEQSDNFLTKPEITFSSKGTKPEVDPLVGSEAESRFIPGASTSTPVSLEPNAAAERSSSTPNLRQRWEALPVHPLLQWGGGQI